jgi:hypothetical protein
MNILFVSIYLSICLSVCLSVSLSIYLSTYPYSPCGLVVAFSVERTPWTGDQHVARTMQKQNERTQTSMPRVGFEPTIPIFKASEDSSCLSAATAMGNFCHCHCKYLNMITLSMHLLASLNSRYISYYQ